MTTSSDDCRKDYIYAAANQIGRERRKQIVSPIRRMVFDLQVLALDVAGFLQALTERRHQGRVPASRCGVEIPDHRHRGLLRPPDDWPRHSTPEARDELPPSHPLSPRLIGAGDYRGAGCKGTGSPSVFWRPSPASSSEGPGTPPSLLLAQAAGPVSVPVKQPTPDRRAVPNSASPLAYLHGHQG